jgi:hypothetical protein
MTQMSRRRATVPAGSPAHCKTENSAITSSLIATAIEDRIGRCDEDKPKPKKEKPAAFSWGK